MKTTVPALSLALLFFVSLCSSQTFSVRREGMLLNGNPYRILSGEMHYCRIPHEYWRDRLLKARAMGLNTICTYVFWNVHEPEPGRFDFSGDRDVARYIRTAKEVGLNVMIRPGPYVCSEWDLGGLPAWLLKDSDIKVRCMDKRYMAAAERYITRLGRELKGLQITQGGPIIMVQVENEYGSYGNDKVYLAKIQEFLRKAGFDVPLYTSDGGAEHLLEAGTLPEVLPVVNFGGSPREQFDVLATFRSGIPQMCGEYWCGWFTHWGDTEWGGSNIDEQQKDIRWMLENGKSFNLYMFHGGTNFGWMAGANYGTKYEPDVTSYDYDAPVDESGRPTKKFFVIRDLIVKGQPGGPPLPPLPDSMPGIVIPEIQFPYTAPLFKNLPAPMHSPQPRPMEEFGQSFGFILYRTRLVGPKSGALTVTELHDYAQVYINGKLIGTLDRSKGENGITVPDTGGKERVLDILVEGMGRINFGQHLIDRKGITERVTLRGITLMNWEVYTLPMDEPYRGSLTFEVQDTLSRPAFFKASFELERVGDTYLDLSKWKKGVVWVNGHHLGRYWDRGPQHRLFTPGVWLKKGVNEVLIFDLHQAEAVPITAKRYLKD